MVATKIPIKVQKRSGFDKSHHCALSQKVGKIVPILCDEVIPNSKIHLRYAMAGSLPPMSSDTYMKCYYDVRAFFIPMRLLWGGFENWFSNYDEPVVLNYGGTNTISSSQSFAPYFSIDPGAQIGNIFDHGTLSDYLGYKFDFASAGNLDTNILVSCLPFFAYHRVCNDWFRQSNITREFYAKPATSTVHVNGSSGYAVASAPFVTYPVSVDAAFPVVSDENDANLLFADGVSVFALRSCNYDYDYFTNALPSAQLGTPMSVNTSGGSFTIGLLRSMNSLQQWSELNMLAGGKLVDMVKARYGANLAHGVAQRCVYLGGARLDIGTRSVEVQTPNSIPPQRNPFTQSVGASAGKVFCQGSDVIIDGFTAQEPGYIMVVGMIIPKVSYGSGVRRYLTHYTPLHSSGATIVDMANPLLQNTGNQPIYDYELTSSLGFANEQVKVFGYTDKYAEFMTMEDEVHGLLQLGGPMQSFVAQRFFNVGDSPVISSSFLEVPITALDNVSYIASTISNFGFYGQFAFDYKVAQPLAQYSLPSLQNPAYEHGKSVMVHRGGFRF